MPRAWARPPAHHLENARARALLACVHRPARRVDRARALSSRSPTLGAQVNTAYYGDGNVIEELMSAAVQLFGRHVLLQFEDFNSNDAFPLLQAMRERFLTYARARARKCS